MVVVSELLGPSLLQCLFGDRGGVGGSEVAQQGGGGDGGRVDEHGLAVGAGEIGQVGAGGPPRLFRTAD